MRHSGLTSLSVGATLFVAACAPATPVSAPRPGPESRIFDSKSRQYIDFAALAEAAAHADVVFFGEQHDNPATHRAELALLAALGGRRSNVVVSLEMFDRDVQPVLDGYLAGQIPESAFVATSRAWPRYNTDYRALVELARAHGWPVVAANPPRRIAAAVSRVGIGALDTMPTLNRAMVARELSCPRDVYYDRFAESMKSHSSGGGPASTRDSSEAATVTGRFYEAQCVKDETMGESIAAAHTKAGVGAIVVHFNGAFHTEMGLGTAARARRRMPGARTMLISAIPVDDVVRADATAFTDRADYIILTPKPPKPKAN